MNVIVWQSYGNVNVYKADTAGQLNTIVALIQTATAMWGRDTEFYAMVQNVKSFVEMNRIDRARRELVNFVRQHCRDTDAFELFELSGVQ